jgi:hypothetical protein
MIPTPLVRNDLLKSLYIGMLQTLPSETRSFWKQHPLSLNGTTMGESALLQHIWEDGTESPLEYLSRVLESLEPFLLQRGIAVEDFVDQISYWGNRGTFLNSRFLLKSLNPLVSRLFSTSDIMSFLLLFTETIGSRLVKGLSFPILKRVVVDENKHVYAMVRVNELFTQNLTPWDGYLYSAKLLRVTPKVLGLPAYDSVDLLSDARAIEKIVWEGETKRREGAFFISGERMGKVVAFSEFCAAHDLNIKPHNLPSTQGVVMEEDYYCPKRKRIVLRKGCFYGAPAYVFKIVYSKNRPQQSNYLFHFIEEATLHDLPSWAALKRNHLDLVESTKENVTIEYRSSEDNIFVGGRELISGKPAKILCRILRENQNSGKTEFVFREFKYDQSLYHSPKNTGFEVSLKRISEVLVERGYSVALSQKGFGKFTLDLGCKIDFRELANPPISTHAST